MVLCRDASNKKTLQSIPLSLPPLALLVHPSPPKKFTERPKVIGDFFVSLSHPPMDKLDTYTYTRTLSSMANRRQRKRIREAEDGVFGQKSLLILFQRTKTGGGHISAGFAKHMNIYTDYLAITFLHLKIYLVNFGVKVWCILYPGRHSTCE